MIDKNSEQSGCIWASMEVVRKLTLLFFFKCRTSARRIGFLLAWPVPLEGRIHFQTMGLKVQTLNVLWQ